MGLLECALVVVAGFAAGAINTIAGAGSVITYPVLVGLGVPPVAANMSNTIGLSPGAVAGAWAYRRELAGHARQLARLVPIALVGATLGAALLTTLPPHAFSAVVPVLILLSSVLVGVQPWLARWTTGRSAGRRGAAPVILWGPLSVAVFMTSVYGGYFSAAQGVLLMGVLGLLMRTDLHQQNGVKNLLQALVNVVAAVFFVIVGGVDWPAVAMLALGSVAGAPAGAWLARRLPAAFFRVGIMAFGVVMALVIAQT